jgi:O-antigen ligase
MLISLKNNWKKLLPVVLTAALIIGLAYSRALLSVASIGFAVVIVTNWKNLTQYKMLLLGIALILLPVIISGFWSEGKTAWYRSVIVKLSLPTVVCGLLAAQLSFNQIKRLIWLLTIIVTTSALYSCFQFLINKELILKNYLEAKVMPVLMDDDHIRYSWLIVLNIVSLLWVVFLKTKNHTESANSDQRIQIHKKWKVKNEQLFASILILFLIAYLHLLAAKTGLVCLYATIIIAAFYLIAKVKWWKGVLLIAAMCLFAFVAYNNLKSLQNRIKYVVYDFGNYSKGIYTEGSSDGDRVLSLKAGMSIISQHLITGVGFGDVQSEVEKWHNLNHPSSKDYERFLPTNQWLIYGAGSGLLGITCFSLGLILLLQPLFFKNIFSFVMSLILLIPLITDDTFEGQFGINIFALMTGMGILIRKKRISMFTVKD